MAFPSFSKRTPPKQRAVRSVGPNDTEAGAIARGKSVQDFATKPGTSGGDDEPFQKLVRFGRKVGKKVLSIGERITGKKY